MVLPSAAQRISEMGARFEAEENVRSLFGVACGRSDVRNKHRVESVVFVSRFPLLTAKAKYLPFGEKTAKSVDGE
jgi:hypothetical protein